MKWRSTWERVLFVNDEVGAVDSGQKDSLDEALALSNDEFDEFIIDFADEPVAAELFSDDEETVPGSMFISFKTCVNVGLVFLIFAFDDDFPAAATR